MESESIDEKMEDKVVIDGNGAVVQAKLAQGTESYENYKYMPYIMLAAVAFCLGLIYCVYKKR